MSSNALQSLENLLSDQPSMPPIHLWSPELSGEMDMVIKPDGQWFHEGDPIKREKLVALFASILRREEDGEYYLLTPVEKWRITVDDAPLLAVDMDVFDEQGVQQLVFTTNVGGRFLLSDDHSLLVKKDSDGQPSPELTLDNGLHAKLARSVFYRLVDLAEEEAGCFVVKSAGRSFALD